MFDIGYYTSFKDIKQTDDNGFIICGHCSEEETTLYDDILLVKTSNTGESEWQKEYFIDASNCEGTKVIKDQDNNYYIAGYAVGISGSKGKADADGNEVSKKIKDGYVSGGIPTHDNG